MPPKLYTIVEAEKLLKESRAIKSEKCLIEKESTKTLRVEMREKNSALRNEITKHVLKLFKNSVTIEKRPNDVLLPGGIKILVKPGKGAKKTASLPYYGFLNRLDLSKYDTTAFSSISPEISRNVLPSKVKEHSDFICVSEFNTALEPLLTDTTGKTLSFLGFQFQNVIGCIPVTAGEPKADVVLVGIKNKKLIPVCFYSYKMGTDATGFQNYSGLSETSAPEIFSAAETIDYYAALNAIVKAKQQSSIAPYRPLKSKKLIGKSVWGMDYGTGGYGINNCHFIAQGTITISGGSIKYSGHSTKNGDFSGLSGSYAPVFGARYTSGRNNRGPGGMYITDYRIGIFPKAYFTEGRSAAKLV